MVRFPLVNVTPDPWGQVQYGHHLRGLKQKEITVRAGRKTNVGKTMRIWSGN